MMTDEQRLHMITEQLLIVRDNLFRGVSKSMQKLLAKSINEVLELPNFTKSFEQLSVSPQRSEDNKERSDWNEQVEPAFWYRNEDIFGNQEMEPIFYATKAWVNCLPLYTHPPVPNAPTELTAQPKE